MFVLTYRRIKRISYYIYFEKKTPRGERVAAKRKERGRGDERER